MEKEHGRSLIIKTVLFGIIAKEAELATGLMVNLPITTNQTYLFWNIIFVLILRAGIKRSETQQDFINGEKSSIRYWRRTLCRNSIQSVLSMTILKVWEWGGQHHLLMLPTMTGP